MGFREVREQKATIDVYGISLFRGLFSKITTISAPVSASWWKRNLWANIR